MNRYEMIEKLETNFMQLNNHDPLTNTNHLWLYDMLGFIYAHISDEKFQELVARSEKKLWEYEQMMNAEIDLAYERSADK